MPWRFQLFNLLDEIAEIGNHFRGASGEIDGKNVRVRKPINDPVNGLACHDFSPLRPGVHMAMRTSQIAKFAHIDLKNLRTRATELQTARCQSLSESVYHFNSGLVSGFLKTRLYQVFISSLERPDVIAKFLQNLRSCEGAHAHDAVRIHDLILGNFVFQRTCIDAFL
jgi:hypothetical protein